MSHHRVRVRRDAIPAQASAVLEITGLGNPVNLTIYGQSARATITDLTPEWVEVEWDDDDQPTNATA